MKKGDDSPQVVDLQNELNKLGASLVADGNFGPLTEMAVIVFQSNHGLAADGIVGPLTQAAINAALKGAVPTSTVCYGVDVYHGDNVTSWQAMKAGGIDFVYIKASQGLSKDSKFVQYYHDAKAAGMIVGAYHFYSASSSQSDQAAFFNSILNAVDYAKEDLPPCFDFENASGDYSAKDFSNAQAFLSSIQTLSSRIPMLYMSASVPAQGGSFMKNYPWWIARYTTASGPGVEPWVLWQFAEAATIPGLGNTGDKNKFRGSVADLKEFIKSTL